MILHPINQKDDYVKYNLDETKVVSFGNGLVVLTQITAS